MERATIDYGIDLGTTNSVICYLNGMNAEIIKNNWASDTTPSAVMIDKKGQVVVGRVAKERVFFDPHNVAFEFKRNMGKEIAFTFQQSGRTLYPEDLSAEVLKALKGDVLKRKGEELGGAVITVPAAFELPQCAATKKAAERAGFSCFPLLQEPVAASLAYGFQSESEKVYWLVYDLGGGTFDAALVNMRDGAFHVVHHLGDRLLGGQLIDWAIVDELLIPAAAKEHALSDFRRDNKHWAAAMAKLKEKAETAKIQLSNEGSVDIDLDFLCNDDRGKAVAFRYELNRSEVERLMEPIIRRTIDYCRDLLEAKGLRVNNIEKVLLVGGPTLTPYLRERLADGKEGLGIPLAIQKDPLTVVAEGAAIFAGGQRVTERSKSSTAPARGYAVQLEYKPIDADPEPLVGGRILADGKLDLSTFTIEFANTSILPVWRSGKVGLDPKGIFSTQLYAEKGVENIFMLELHDGKGNRLDTTPDRFSYRIGRAFEELPLTNSLGISLADNTVAMIAQKGSPLPIRKRLNLRSTVDLCRGETGDLICIPLHEGESERADRNVVIEMLRIHPQDVKRDVPAGSELELTVEIDASRIITMEAYIPILDEAYKVTVDYNAYKVNPMAYEQFEKEFEFEKNRLDTLQKEVDACDDADARAAIQRIYSRRMVQEMEAMLVSTADRAEKLDRTCQRLLELKSALDRVEDALAWPKLADEAEKLIKMDRELLERSDSKPMPRERESSLRLEKEIQDLLAAGDRTQMTLLRKKMDEKDRIGWAIEMRRPGWWVYQVQSLENKRLSMQNRAEADVCFSSAHRAIQNNDIEGVEAAVRQLWGLLPEGDLDKKKGDSTVTL